MAASEALSVSYVHRAMTLQYATYDNLLYRTGAVRNFPESRICELRLVPTPMGENFSGSCIVTSRNLLIHIGATTATNSERFGAGGVHQGLLSRG
jgi:hypothetical protein